MLTVQTIACCEDRYHYLRAFDPNSQTWVVADLAAKNQILEILMRDRRFLPGDCVVRANELWQRLLTRTRPDLQLVSTDLACGLISDFLENLTHLEWVQTPGAAPLLYQYICQLIPILSHPHGDEQMSEWFSQHRESYHRWGPWYELASETWKIFLERGWLATSWVSGVLVNQSQFESVWQRPLVVDLGPELNHIEAELLLHLSRSLELSVLEPRPDWREEFQKCLGAYDILRQNQRVKPTRQIMQVPTTEYRKFTTMLAEVKDATGQVRQWLNDGADPRDIAIVLPDVDLYWPVLASYLGEEGIPAEKSGTSTLQTLPQVTRWLSCLRLKMGQVSASDLEVGVFANVDEPNVQFERFHRLFAQIYGVEDLSRDESLQKFWQVEMDPQAKITRDDFLTWSLKYWDRQADSAILERLAAQIFHECSHNLSMRLKNWLQFLEQLICQMEMPTSSEISDGIRISHLLNAPHLECRHVIVLGLSESALQSKSRTSILQADVMSLAASNGFHLASQDQSRLEFAARWLLHGSNKEFVLCYPATDFKGSPLAPALFWLQGAMLQDQAQRVTTPKMTRWDQIQQADFSHIVGLREADPEMRALRVLSIEQDLGFRKSSEFGIGAEFSLSASSIEKFLDCPFTFAAQRLFKLSDLPSLDLDVDALTRGNLMHGLFEALLRPPIRWDWTDDEILQLIDQCRQRKGADMADARLWPPLRLRYLELARQFLRFEKQWRERFPATHTLGLEVPVHGYVTKTGELQKDNSPDSRLFRGSIDRIDGDHQAHAVILDYKSSAASVAGPQNWLRDRKLQLALYAMALEAGMAEGIDSQEVVGAFYYISRGLQRDTGLHLEEFDGLFHQSKKPSRHKWNLADKKKIWNEIQTTLSKALSKMQAGLFFAEPADRELCNTCKWSGLCRAPHLN